MTHPLTLFTFLAVAVVAECVPVPLEIVDMTYVFDNSTLNWPTVKKFQMQVETNGTQEEGYWLQSESISSGTHAGTHLDAPCHFARGRWCVDAIPISRFFAPAAVIDYSGRASRDPDALVSVCDLREWEEGTGRNLDGHIVLVRSGWGSRWHNKKAYLGTDSDDVSQLRFPGVSREAAQWLVDNRDIYGLGTDSVSMDSGQTKDSMVHRILLGNNIYGMENVANMDRLPISGAMLSVLPMKIGKASGAPVRIVAKFKKFEQYDSEVGWPGL